MKSSSQTYLSNLDHLRAFAAFMVFIWHFTHYDTSCPNMQCQGLYHITTPFFTVLEQGYTGVALFMCISGYIFTLLAHGKRLSLPAFWLNRFLRLLPLVIFWGISESLVPLSLMIDGTAPWWPQLQALIPKILNPQGSCTIYIELQYYLALPLILWAVARYGVKTLAGMLLALVAYRAYVWSATGSVQPTAYWTIWGHADQFVVGTMAFHLEQAIKARHAAPARALKLLGLVGIAMVLTLYQYVQWRGGLYEYGQPSTDPIWILLPTIESLGYSLIIIAYLQLKLPGFFDRMLSAMGRWSYSIYLNHFQLLPFLVIFAYTRFGMGQGFYEKLTVATFLVFPLVVLFSAATYGIVEKPFLALRRNYLRAAPSK